MERVAPALELVVVGETVVDTGESWRELYGVSDGAVVVRPDGHVAWRSADAVDDPFEALQAVLDRILCVPGRAMET